MTAVDRSDATDPRIVSRSPQEPDDVVVATSAVAPSEVADRATRARAAQRDWVEVTALARATALGAAADAVANAAEELGTLLTREIGKPQLESKAEVGRAVAILRFYAQQALAADGETFPGNGPAASFVMTRRQPYGLATLVTPWNFPVMIPTWKAAPALASGNAVLLKPAPAATACALRLGELLANALPNDLFQVLPGGAQTGSAAMDAGDVISFTGSTPVGKAIVAQAHQAGIPVQAEMGGLNASIVLPDADPDRTAATIAAAAMGYAGQKCTATSRVIVVGANPRFIQALVAAVRALPTGDPRDPATVVGPVISEAAREQVLEATGQAQRDGGQILTGGSSAAPGWSVQPTLVGGLEASSWAAQTEVFGPFCVVLPVGSIDEAVRVANDTPYGLSTAVFTGDLDQVLALPARLRSGMVRINAATTGVDFHMPFGGMGESGRGERELGTAAANFFTRQQTITVQPR
ncbi:MAG: aldehyde dehydrogenase family protein [Candidatus Dormibacteria bacterium]